MSHVSDLLDWYLSKCSSAQKVEPDTEQVLRDLAQLVAWYAFGECRGFSDRLLTPAHALTMARAVLESSQGCKMENEKLRGLLKTLADVDFGASGWTEAAERAAIQARKAIA